MASASPSSPKFHVLAFPVPGQGHISPMMHLCKRIAAQDNFTVSFVNVDSLHSEMIKYWKAPPNADIRLVSIPLSSKIPHALDAKTLTNLGAFFKTTIEMVPALEELIRKLSEEISPVRCIISDFYFYWTQDVADKFGIPRFILLTVSAALTALEYQIPELLKGNHVFPSLTPDKRLVADECKVDVVKGVGNLHQADVPLYLQGDDPLWAEYSLQRVHSIRQASCVLINSFHDLEPEAFDFMAKELPSTKILSVGPLFLLAEETTNVVLRNENDDCMQWLDKQQHTSVIYLSFGSIEVLSVDQFEEITAALEATGKPFLWVIRPGLLVGASTEIYESFLKRTSEQGFVVSWAPQLRVLEHPAIAVFFSHCGWSSVLESVSNGVPLICWPCGGEQNTNAKLVVEDWKIGARFGKDGVVRRNAIEKVVREVMDGEEGKRMKEAAEELKCKARKAVESDGLSAVNLENFLADLMNQAS